MLLLARFGQMREGLAAQIDHAIDMTSRQVLRGHAETPAEKAIVDDLKTKMKAVIDDELSWDKIKGAYIRIYSDNFSQEQIDGLIAFYQTPTGQAFAEHQPVIEQQIQGRLQPQMVPLTMKVQTLIREAMLKLRDLTNAAAEAAAAPKPAASPAPAPAAAPATPTKPGDQTQKALPKP